MSRHAGVSPATVQRIWHAFGLKPHLQETFKLSTDPHFVDKVRDVVGLYMAPPIAPFAVRGREEPDPGSGSHPTRVTTDVWQTQHAHARLQAPWHNVAVCSAGCITGKVIGQLKRRHRSVEFTAVPQSHRCSGAWRTRHPPDHVDNYGTHKTQAVRAWQLAAHPRYHVHFTPTSASWLNLVERFFSQISEQWIKRSAHTSVAQLEQSIREYIDRHNEDPKPFVWHKSADTILASVARAASTII